MRDFSNHNLIEGTAAINRFSSVDGSYRQSPNLNNVVLFPGCRNDDIASSANVRSNNDKASSANVRSNNDMKARAAARLAAREYADWYRPDESWGTMDAIVGEKSYRARSKELWSKESECGLRAYVDYFSAIVDMMASTVRDGSCFGTPGPITSKAESAIAGTLVSVICLFTALL